MTLQDDIITPTRQQAQATTRRKMRPDSFVQNRAEEPELIRAWQENGCNRSLTLLVQRYRPMIGTQIKKILAGRSVSDSHRPDLNQEAILAFIQAVNAFDPSYGVSLAGFAQNHMRKTLLRYALDYRYCYRIGTSSNERKAFYAALARRADLVHKGESDVLTDEDITRIQKSTGASVKSARRAVASLYTSQTDVGEETDLTDGTDSGDQDHAMSIGVAMEVLAPFFETLDARQTAILKAYLSDDDVPVQELAEAFGLTVERIGQIRRDMLTDMAYFLRKKGIDRNDIFG